MSVIINNTTYFTGPLYTNNIYSNNIITIINNSNNVTINTNNLSCKNVNTYTLYTNTITSNNTSILLGKPINYVNTNYIAPTSTTTFGNNITTNYNISNTLGYTNALFMKSSPTLIPTGSTYPWLGMYTIVTTANISSLGSLTVPEPGVYIIYAFMCIYTENPANNMHLNNMYSQLYVNGQLNIQFTEMEQIKCYKNGTTGEWANDSYLYSKIFVCNVTTSNCLIEWKININSTQFKYYFRGVADDLWLNLFSIKIA